MKRVRRDLVEEREQRVVRVPLVRSDRGATTAESIAGAVERVDWTASGSVAGVDVTGGNQDQWECGESRRYWKLTQRTGVVR